MRRYNSKPTKRIFLSPPHMCGEEIQFIRKAFESNYIAPLGPMVDAFEREFAGYIGIKHCLALSSGTAAIHLALCHLGISPNDEVFASTLTFFGSVTPIIFQGAIPVFIDCDRGSWNMAPDLLAEELERCAKRGNLPKAVIPTDLYGQCADYNRIFEICKRYDVPVIVDAAEALGAMYLCPDDRRQTTDDGGQKTPVKPLSNTGSHEGCFTGQAEDRGSGSKDTYSTSDQLTTHNSQPASYHHAGVGAKAAIYSFNGNKIITTSGGGMLASEDKDLIDHARKLSQQARENFPHYEHEEIGYNYRMSNILAAIGLGQLKVLEERVKRKREIFNYYFNALSNVSGIEFMPEAPYGRSNRWLTVVLISPEEFGSDRETVRIMLEAENIEARPVWKPMHMQPVFMVEEEIEKRKEKTGKMRYDARVVGGEVAEDLFNRGLCLPSGTAMTEEDLERVVETVLKCRK